MKHLKYALVICSLFFGALCFAEERQPVYLLGVDGVQEIIYVDAPKEFSYEFNVYRGTLGNLKKLDVKRVSRLRDGGTTIISLQDGSSIYVPSAFKQNVDSTFTSAQAGSHRLIKHVTTPEKIASFGIDQANPLKAKSPIVVSQAEQSEVIEAKSAKEESLKPNPLEANDVQIDHAFRDQDGNLIVRFKYGAKSIGTNMTFWGPKHDGRLYQLQETGFGGTMSEYKLTFMAPTDANAQRRAEIQVENGGKMTVSCEGGSKCFLQMSESEERALETTLKAGIIGLEGLPNVRRVEYVFKVAGTEKYVLVDAPQFNYSYDFEVFIGEKGNLQRVEVTRVRRMRDGGTTQISLADGRIIYSPTPSKKEQAKLLASSEDRVGEILEVQEKSIAKVESLGVNTKRFKIAELKTPVSGANRCEMFYR